MFRESLNRIHPHSRAPSNGRPVGLILQSDAAKGYCLPNALEDRTPKTIRSSLSQRDRIKYLGSLVFPPLRLFFPFSFSRQPLSPAPLWSRVPGALTHLESSQKKRQKEAGGGGETESTSRGESERVKNFEMCGGFPAVEQNWTVAAFQSSGFLSSLLKRNLTHILTLVFHMKSV